MDLSLLHRVLSHPCGETGLYFLICKSHFANFWAWILWVLTTGRKQDLTYSCHLVQFPATTWTAVVHLCERLYYIQTQIFSCKKSWLLKHLFSHVQNALPCLGALLDSRCMAGTRENSSHEHQCAFPWFLVLLTPLTDLALYCCFSGKSKTWTPQGWKTNLGSSSWLG